MSAAQSRWFALLSAAIIAAAVVAVYWNSFSGAMVLDDLGWIRDNASIHRLSSIGDVLFPHNMGALGGRPLVSLSLAINYAIGGTDPAGYHAVNLAIHLLAALTLFGLVRRTLMLPSLGDRCHAAATPLAFAVALVWAVHPLTTAAVTYIIQRTESLMALLYLVTLYCFVRGTTTSAEHPLARRLWYAASVLACALGMVTKEVMFTAPLVALLYDSFFVAGSFRRAISERHWLYGCLAATWSLGALMLWLTEFHANTTGFGVAAFTWQSYVLTQPGVILHYLQSAFWPADLCLDYGWPAVNSIWQVVLPGIVVAALLAATVFGLAKRSPLGFLGACFFLILAPTFELYSGFRRGLRPSHVSATRGPDGAGRDRRLRLVESDCRRQHGIGERWESSPLAPSVDTLGRRRRRAGLGHDQAESGFRIRGGDLARCDRQAT